MAVGTKADVVSAIPWKTPAYYTGYDTNSLFQDRMGNNVWALIPTAGLPTVDGMSNGVPATRAFFRLSNPRPEE